MAQVLSGIPKIVYYIDDILITGHTRAEHIENLWMVRIKSIKRVWAQTEALQV